jgi:hypothetical protein
MKRYTAKVSFQFAFECPDKANPKTEATELIEYVGAAFSESDWKRDTLKIKIFDFDTYKPSDYEEGEYVLYTQYVKKETNE